MNDPVYMTRALELAREAAQRGEVPIGAVVVFQDQIVGEGSNSREGERRPTGHAEILAIEAAARKLDRWRLTGCHLYVTLEPCPMCLGACQQARLERVVYGAKDPKGGAESLGFDLHSDSRLNHSFLLEYNDFPESGELLRQFFRARR